MTYPAAIFSTSITIRVIYNDGNVMVGNKSKSNHDSIIDKSNP